MKNKTKKLEMINKCHDQSVKRKQEEQQENMNRRMDIKNG